MPVVVSFPESAARQDCWGKLDSLAPSGATLSTRFTVEQGERLFLTLRIGDYEFRGIAALAGHVRVDRDGYRLVGLAFTDAAQKRALAKSLLDLLATH
ncbi:MAG: hypothetical protein HY924_09260 [Elusimicrobia bacterium]|nr:hypothetical protein [Elusimicrobiota bacterium]